MLLSMPGWNFQACCPGTVLTTSLPSAGHLAVLVVQLECHPICLSYYASLDSLSGKLHFEATVMLFW